MPEDGDPRERGDLGQGGPIRVLHFADLVNRHDFIDNIVRHSSLSMAVCTMGQPSNIEDPGYRDIGIECWVIPSSKRRHYLLAAFRLATLLRRQQIDIIHAHHYDPCLIAAAATMLRPRTKLVVGRHYSDAIYLHTAGCRRWAMLLIEGLVNRRAHRLIVPARRIIELLVERQGVAVAKVAHIPYGFDPEVFDRADPKVIRNIRQCLAIEDKFTIATFGRLYEDKGHRFVLDALPELVRTLPTLRYLIVGEGPERARLERQVADLGMGEIVTFLGWRHDVPELLGAVDVVVQPSLQEAFSQSMAEALLMGRPLIISDVSGASELVPDRAIGRVVPVGDTTALIRVITELMDAPLRARLGKAGQRHVREHFTIEAAVTRHDAVYREAVATAIDRSDGAPAATRARFFRTREDRTDPRRRAG